VSSAHHQRCLRHCTAGSCGAIYNMLQPACSLRVRLMFGVLYAAAKRRMRPMTFEYGCELLRWLEEAETFALAPLENRCE